MEVPQLTRARFGVVLKVQATGRGARRANIAPKLELTLALGSLSRDRRSLTQCRGGCLDVSPNV